MESRGFTLQTEHRMLASNRFQSFLEFEGTVFGDDHPVPAYDPYLIRYGEYRFVLDNLSLQQGGLVLDLGSASNIFVLYLAYCGAQAIAVDLDPDVFGELQRRKKAVESVTGRRLAIATRTEDATQLTLEAGSVDEVVAVSALEHMYSDLGHGDQLAVSSVARVLKTGGVAAITVPMSDGAPFHESRTGDARFAGPYRLYTPDALEERILSHPDMETVSVNYIAHSTPDPRYDHLHFFRFWMESLSADERWKWAWANAALAQVFNPIVSQDEGESRLETVNTALICLRKK